MCVFCTQFTFQGRTRIGPLLLGSFLDTGVFGVAFVCVGDRFTQWQKRANTHTPPPSPLSLSPLSLLSLSFRGLRQTIGGNQHVFAGVVLAAAAAMVIGCCCCFAHTLLLLLLLCYGNLPDYLTWRGESHNGCADTRRKKKGPPPERLASSSICPGYVCVLGLASASPSSVS